MKSVWGTILQSKVGCCLQPCVIVSAVTISVTLTAARAAWRSQHRQQRHRQICDNEALHFRWSTCRLLLGWVGWWSRCKLLFNSLFLLWGRIALLKRWDSEEIKLVCIKGSQFLGNLFRHQREPLGLLSLIMQGSLIGLEGIGFQYLYSSNDTILGFMCPSERNALFTDFGMSSCWLKSSKCWVNSPLLCRYIEHPLFRI